MTLELIYNELRELRHEVEGLREDRAKDLLNTKQACEYLGLSSASHFSNKIGPLLERQRKGREYLYARNVLDRYKYKR